MVIDIGKASIGFEAVSYTLNNDIGFQRMFLWRKTSC